MINQQLFTSFRSLCVWATLAASAVLAGCSSTSLNRAPVEDRNAAASASATPTSTVTANGASVPALPFKPLPGAENAGKPGYYSVRPGDTIIRIGLEHTIQSSISLCN